MSTDDGEMLLEIAGLLEKWGAARVISAMSDACDACGDVMSSQDYHGAALSLREAVEFVESAMTEPDAVPLSGGCEVLAESDDSDDGEDADAEPYAEEKDPRANPHCKVCHGTGIVRERHPYGSTVAVEELECECADGT